MEELAKKLDIDNFIDITTRNMVNGINYEIINTSHDAVKPFGLIFNGKQKLVHLTDTGYLSKKIIKACTGAYCYLIESNYEDELLINNNRYPFLIKKRIIGDLGHLSNDECHRGLIKMITDNTKYVLFGHISENNNLRHLVAERNESLDVKNKIILLKDENVVINFES